MTSKKNSLELIKLSSINASIDRTQFPFHVGKPFKEELLMPLRSSRMSLEIDEPAEMKLDTIDKIQDIVRKVC